MREPKKLALYGMEFDPFLPSLPPKALWRPPDIEAFIYRIENLVLDGGFGLITGDPGYGKSKALHLLALHLKDLCDVVVGVMQRPQSALGDFYRELGDIFGVDLSPANRYGGFKALRARWRAHIKSTLFRPVLLIDEAQEMATPCLNELRLLGSAEFDSEILLTTVLCGDKRLQNRFRSPQLLPLGSRIRTRLVLEAYDKATLTAFLDHILQQAGAPHLLTEGLRDALVEHAAGSPRVLTTMGAELLAVAAARELPRLDEKLFLELYSIQPRTASRPGRKA
ncbi:MAG: AAA family ATPase [Pseudomonadota bacterium]